MQDRESSLPEVEWPPTAHAESEPNTEGPQHGAERSKTPSEGATSACVTPGHRARSEHANAPSAHATEQAYDEFVRMQSVTRYMLTEKERGVRTLFTRLEHDAWLAVRQAEREERLRLGGEATQPTTPETSFQCLPLPDGAETVTLSPQREALFPDNRGAVGSNVVEGNDRISEVWRDRFRGIFIKPSPGCGMQVDGKPAESRCCSLQ